MSQKSKMLVSLVASFVLAGGAGAYAFFGVFQKEEAEKATKEAEAKLFPLEAGSVTKLLVQGKGDETRLEKRDGVWWIVSPLTTLADTAEVEGLLERLALAKREKVIQEDADLSAFGLENPAIHLEAESATGEKAYLSIGNENTFDRTYFLSNAPALVGSGNASLPSALEKGLFDLRDKKPLVFGKDTLTSLELQGKEAITLARRDGRWNLESPTRETADEEEVDSILQALQDLRATAFPPEEVIQGVAPAYTLTLHRAEGDPLSLRIWEVGGKVFAREGDRDLAEVDENLLGSLQKEPKDLRDRRVAPFESNLVGKVDFVFGQERVTVERVDDTEWEVTSPERAPARRWRMNAALSNLAELRADELLPSSAAPDHGLAPPTRSIELRSKDGAPMGSFHLGSEEGGFVYLQVKGRDPLFKVTASHLGNLPRSLADVKEAPAEIPVDGEGLAEE